MSRMAATATMPPGLRPRASFAHTRRPSWRTPSHSSPVVSVKAGAVEFLTKPVREQDLLDAINVALGVHNTARHLIVSYASDNF